MSAPNPWHETFEGLCTEMGEHWNGCTVNFTHGRDETLYDPIFSAEIRGVDVQVDLSENATPSDPDLSDTGGEAEFLRASVHTFSGTMLALTPRRTGSRDRFREHTFDAFADRLVLCDAFRAIVARLQPFALLRVEPWGFFWGRRIRDAADLTLDRIRDPVEALVDLVLLCRREAMPPPAGHFAQLGRA
jgi:hypothetical protein